MFRNGKESEVRQMVYKWSLSESQYPVSADVVGKHFEKLKEEHGAVTRENFLDSARDENSPVHDIFEWDDSVAGEKYRLHQASTCICSLRVEVEDVSGEPITIRAYVNTDTHGDAKFVAIHEAMENEDTKAKVLEDAKKYLKWFVDKYENLVELSKIVETINEFLEVGA